MATMPLIIPGKGVLSVASKRGMARKPRIEFEGAIDLLKRATERYLWELLTSL
jgi:hypothetical protein